MADSRHAWFDAEFETETPLAEDCTASLEALRPVSSFDGGT